LIKNVLRKNKNICLLYIMHKHKHKHKTRRRRKKQLTRARGMNMHEPGSVASAAAKQRAFLIGNDGTKTPVRRLGGLQRYNIVPADELSRFDIINEMRAAEARAAAAEVEEAEAEEASSQALEDETEVGFFERHRINIFLSLLLGLFVIYVPGAREKAMAKIAHNASWSVYFKLNSVEKITILDEILTSHTSDNVITFLTTIQQSVPNLFHAVNDVFAGVKGAVYSQKSLTGLILKIIGKVNIITGIRNLYLYLKRPQTEPVPGNIVPDDLDEELMKFKEREIEEMSDGLSVQDPEAIGKLLAGIGGGSIRKKNIEKPKNDYQKKQKKQKRSALINALCRKNDVVNINRLKEDIESLAGQENKVILF